MFELICKKSCFSRQFVKLTIKACLILRVGPTETHNQDVRPLLDSFRHHESNSSLRIDKRAFIENHIFCGKRYCLVLREISIS